MYFYEDSTNTSTFTIVSFVLTKQKSNYLLHARRKVVFLTLHRIRTLRKSDRISVLASLKLQRNVLLVSKMRVTLTQKY